MEKVQRLPSTFLGLLFGPSGVIDRARFVAGAVGLAALGMATEGVASLASDGLGLVSFGFALMVMWSGGCLSRKRLHDLGCSGWWIVAFLTVNVALVMAAPFVFQLSAAGAWRHPGFVAACLAFPTVSWLCFLAVMPGETARQAARRARMTAGNLPPIGGGLATSLRAGRM